MAPRRPTSPTRTTRAAAATPGRATSTTGSCAAGREPGWRTSATVSRSTTSGASSSSSRRSRTHAEAERHPRAEGLHRLAAVEGAARLARRRTQKLTRQRVVRQEAGDRPVHEGGDARLPGPRPRRQLLHQRDDGDAVAARRRATRSGRSTIDLLNRAWAEAKARGEKLPPVSQKLIPPEVPGQQ